MAITDYKITDGEITQRNVQSAPDTLSDTPSENKAVFDNLTEYFIGKYNDLIDNINSDFVDSSEFAEGFTVTDKVRWRYALTKGTSIGLNFSGNITQITTGFRTIVGDIDGLTETDFMDCYLSINGTDYECGDSYTSGNSILTSAVINGVTVDIIYDTANGNITLEHATNPLDTLYWNVSIYRSVAEKVPRKALPASVSNDGYTELDDRLEEVEDNGKWHSVGLDLAPKATHMSDSITKAFNNDTASISMLKPALVGTSVQIDVIKSGTTDTYSINVGSTSATTIVDENSNIVQASLDYNTTGGEVVGVSFSGDVVSSREYKVTWEAEADYTERYIPTMSALADDTAHLSPAENILKDVLIVKSITVETGISVTAGSYTETDKSISQQGYVPMGVVGISVVNGDGGVNGSTVVPSIWYVVPNESRMHYRLQNRGASNATVTLRADILYRRAY